MKQSKLTTARSNPRSFFLAWLLTGMLAMAGTSLASDPGSISGSTTLTVTNAVLVSLEVTPNNRFGTSGGARPSLQRHRHVFGHYNAGPDRCGHVVFQRWIGSNHLECCRLERRCQWDIARHNPDFGAVRLDLGFNNADGDERCAGVARSNAQRSGRYQRWRAPKPSAPPAGFRTRQRGT